MNRRQFLALGTTGMGLFAGCPSQSDTPPSTTSPTPTESATATATTTPTATPVPELPWSQLPGPPGGPVTDISLSRADPTHIYASTETAGLYASADGGQSWIQGPESEHHRRTIVASPHDPLTARTSVNRTVDGGDTWFTAGHNPERRRLPSVSVEDIAYDPVVEDRLYAGTGQGIYRTVDGGETWEKRPVDVTTKSELVTWVSAAPDAEGVVYAGYYADATIVRSLNGGRSWEVVIKPDEISGTLRGLVAERSGATAYICVDGRGVYRVGDGSPRHIGPQVGDELRGPYFFTGPTVSADDARLYVYAFGLAEGETADDMFEHVKLYEYHRATDTMRTVTTPEKPASITAHPTAPATVYFGGWSWVWESTDTGETWTKLANKFVDRYLSTVGTNHDQAGTVVPGSICSGGVWVSRDHGATYTWKRSGLENFERADGERHYEEHYAMRAAGGGNRLYVTTAAGLLISADNGATWRLETGVPGYDSHGLDHYHGVGVDPKDPRHVIIGTGLGRHAETNEESSYHPTLDRPTRMWRSTDGGGTWQEIVTGFPADRRTVIQDILISHADSSRVYAGTNANDYIAVGRGDAGGTGLGIYRSSNAGSTWAELPTPFDNIHGLDQDATNPDTVYASTPQGVYRSPDAGNEWQQVLPYPSKALLTHPKSSGVVFVGSKKYPDYWDVLVSTDGGDTWIEGNLTIQVGTEADARTYDGVARNSDYRGDKGQIMDFAFEDAKSHVIAATRGVGLWRCRASSLTN